MYFAVARAILVWRGRAAGHAVAGRLCDGTTPWEAVVRCRLSLVTLAFGVALLVAGCSQQPTPEPKVSSFTTSPSALASSGGSTSLSWSGSNATDYTLSVSPSACEKVNGASCVKVVDL